MSLRLQAACIGQGLANLDKYRLCGPGGKIKACVYVLP